MVELFFQLLAIILQLTNIAPKWLENTRKQWELKTLSKSSVVLTTNQQNYVRVVCLKDIVCPHSLTDK